MMQTTERKNDLQGAQVKALEFLILTLSGQAYGLAYESVERVRENQRIISIAGMPVFILGVVHLEGDVIPVLDLGRRLGHGAAQGGGVQTIVIAELDGYRLALTVDDVSAATAFNVAQIRPAPPGSSIAAGYAIGVGTQGGRALPLLDLEKLMFDVEMEVLDRLAM